MTSTIHAPAAPLCYLLPEYRLHDSQHFAHLPALFAKLAVLTPLTVLVERGGVPLRIENAKVIHQRFGSRKTLRGLELLWKAIQIRRSGCRKFIVRISRGSALVLIALSWVSDVEVYFWHSGDVERVPRPKAGMRADIRHRIDQASLGFVIRNATGFLTGPESMVDYYVEQYRVDPKRCIVIYNDIDLSRIRPLPKEPRDRLRGNLGITPEECVVVVGARLSHLKGGDFIPLIASALARGGSRALLLVAGASEKPVMGLPNLRYLGPLPNEELQDLLSLADARLVPSRSEGFPRSVLEAMAAGLPIVAFKVGGIPDICGSLQNQFLAAPGDVDEIVKMIRLIEADSHLRSALSDENRRQVVRFDTKEVAQMIVDRVARS